MKNQIDFTSELSQLTNELATLPVGRSHMNKIQDEIRRLLIASQIQKCDQFNSANPCWRR